MNKNTCWLRFVLLAVLTAALWVALFKSIFPIAPVLYSLSGVLSL